MDDEPAVYTAQPADAFSDQNELASTGTADLYLPDTKGANPVKDW